MSETCGCCEGPVAPTPKLVTNRPGLSAVAYRVGDFASFRQAMLHGIAGQRALAGWTSRASDDYGIALVEMWAYVADILTFYQERIANEAYLRTARQRESVLRLASMLGYEPASGVAASVLIAFIADKGMTVGITPGLRVQSVPGQDEQPQKFETVEGLTAVAALNQFRIFPQPTAINPLAPGTAAVTALGDTSHLAAGNRLAIYRQGGAGAAVEDKEITSIETVDWRQQISFAPPVAANLGSAPEMHQWARKLRLFGHNAPSTFFSVSADSNGVVRWRQDSYSYHLPATSSLKLDAVYDDLKVGAEVLIVAQLNSGAPLVQRATITAVAQVVAEVKASSAGAAGKTDVIVSKNPGKTIKTGVVAAPPAASLAVGQVGTLDSGLKLSSGATSTPVAAAMQSTVTQVTLGSALPAGTDVRTAVVYELAGPALHLWNKQYGDRISGDQVYAPLAILGDDLDEVQSQLQKGRRLLLEDAKGAVFASTVDAVILTGDHLRITMHDGLGDSQALDAATATARGNVALATHGESVRGEVLGNGDATQAFQSFTLKKSPVTHVPAAGAAHGAANTLEVRVDGVLWREVDTLFGQPSTARVYTTHVDEDGAMAVHFGDGKTGARLPSGRNNVVAEYRQGIGAAGNVAAGSLRTPLDKPLGLKETTNPDPAEGGAEQENLEEARANAPNSVRTFGRIVSLRDFEDAAREYAGIAKARAIWEWDKASKEQLVVLAVAGNNGATVEPGSLTHSNLVADLDLRRDPNRRLRVISFTPTPLVVEAALAVDQAHDSEVVRQAAAAALNAYLAFDALDLGQSIHLSDVYRVLQAVQGVKAAMIKRLQYKSTADRAAHGVAADPALAHVPIFAFELATVEKPLDDVVITVGLT